MELQMYAPILGVIGFVIAIVIYNVIKAQPEGNDTMKEIAEAIRAGAMAFLKREYTVLAGSSSCWSSSSSSWRPASAFRPPWPSSAARSARCSAASSA